MTSVGTPRPALAATVALALALVLLAAGCAPSSDGPSSAPGAGSDEAASDEGDASGGASSGESTEDAGSTIAGPAGSALEPVDLEAGVRIGRGRAVTATTAGSTTVVATTIGAQLLVGGQWQPLDLPPELGPPTGIDLSDDGTRLAVWWPEQAQLWAVDGDPSQVRPIETEGATIGFAGSEALVVTDRSVLVLDQSDGSELAGHTAPDRLRFGPITSDPAGGWWAAALVDPAGPDQLLIVADGAEPVTTAIAGSDQLDAYQLEADHTGRRLFVGLSPDGQRFSGGEIVAVDLADGLAGDLADGAGETAATATTIEAAAMWTVGTDGGLIVVGQGGYLLIDADGEPGLAQTLPDGYPPFAVHARSGGRFLIIRQDASRLTIDGDRLDSESVPPGRFALSSQQAGAPASVSVVDQTGAITVVGDDDAVRDLDDLVAGIINDIDVAANGDLAAATSTGSINLLSDGVPAATTGAGDTGVSGGDGWTSEFAHAEGNVDTVVFSPDGARLVGGVAERRSEVIFDDTVAVWDLTDEQRIAEIGGEREEVQDCSSFANIVRLSSDGSFLVGVSHDFTVFVLDGTTFEPLQTMPAHAAPINDLALSPDDRWLVTTSEDSTTRVWDLQTGELAADYPTILGGYRSVDFLAGSDRLLVADRQGGLSVLDALTGEVLSTFESVVSGASDIDVSPDGRLVAAGDGPLLRIWDAETGQVVDEFVGHYGSVTTTAFSPDGSAVVSGSNDGTAVVWQLAA